MFFLEFFFVFRTQVHDGFHVDFVERSQNRVFLLRSQETLSNAGAQAAHRNALFRTCARWNRCRRSSGCSGRFGGGVLHIFFQDATVAAGTLQRVHIHAGFRCQFGGGRHGSIGLRSSGSGFRRRRGDWGFSRSGSGCCGVDACQYLFGSNGFAVLSDDFNQYAGLWRRYFQNHFVGFDVNQDFVARYGFADFFLPFQERAFGYAFRQHGYFYVNNHFVSPDGRWFSDDLLCVISFVWRAFRLKCFIRNAAPYCVTASLRLQPVVSAGRRVCSYSRRLAMRCSDGRHKTVFGFRR